MAYLRRSPSLFFIPLVPYPPLRGTFPSRGRLCSSIAVLSYRSLPHWGRGTASAVDRVLSYNACLRRIFHLFQLSFMPLEPYPARYARHLPHAGKAGDTRETCHPQTFGHRPVYICGEAATRTQNPEPQNLVKQNLLTRAFSSCIITSVVVMNYVY